jgi:hypothetical protein
MPSPAFLTGSQIYGAPRLDSDWDLCVFMREDEARKLHAAFCTTSYGVGPSFAFAIGALNVIVFTSETHYNVWQNSTSRMRKVKDEMGLSIDREKAKAYILKQLEILK